MKSRSRFLSLLLSACMLLATCTAQAEPEPTSVPQSAPLLSYGLNVLDLDGGYLRGHNLSNERLSEGVVVSLSETEPFGSKMSFVVFYKDQLLPFYIGDQTTQQYQHFFTVSDEGTAEFIVRFPLELLNERVEPGTCMYFILLGSIDYALQHKYDMQSFCSFAMFNMLCGNEPENTPLEFDIDYLTFPFCLIRFKYIDGEETDTWQYQVTQNDTPLLAFENEQPFSSPYEKGVVIPIVNGSLLMEDDAPMIIHPESMDGIEKFTIQPKLNKGANPILFLYLPTGKRASYGEASSELYTIVVE